MILARAPLRISFAGGGTDLPAFIERHGYGRVVSATLDSYVYVAVKQRFEGDVRLSYSQTEIAPTAHDLHHSIIRAACLGAGVRAGVEIVTLADVPGKGTGLGSSGALAAAAVLALRSYAERPTDAALTANIAASIEHAHGGGYQDVYASAYGGVRSYTFEQDGVTNGEVACDLADLARHLLLIQVGGGRDAGAILRQQQAVVSDYDAEMLAMRSQVDVAEQIVECGDWQALGEVLSEGWYRKRRLPGATSEAVDAALRAAQKAGAWGGKLCGAGGGGFLLLVAPPEAHAAIRAAVPGRGLPVKLSQQGARIVYDQR